MTAVRPLPDFESRPDLPIALVLGAGAMGMTIAQRLGQAHRVVLASLGATELDQGQSRLHELGVVSATIRCDIALAATVEALAARLAEWGPVQTLCHVVGLSPSMSTGPVILAVNLVGAALLEQAVGPLMARGGAGVFISSMAAHFIDPPAAVRDVLDRPLAEDLLPRLEAAFGGSLTSAQAYTYSKLGLNRLVQRQAGPWGKRRARINSISPGLIDTPMGALESVGESGSRRGAMRSRLPLPRDGSMADIADAVEFLVSARAAYITGTDLLVDGGMTAAIRHPKGGA